MKHFALAFCIALAAYIGLYSLLQYQRARKGPWQVTFTNQPSGEAAILVNQPSLKITNVTLCFPGHTGGAGSSHTVSFDAARAVPFEVPFGQCVFVDNTFLPGSVTLQLFSNQIELLPQSLILNTRKQPWPSNHAVLAVPAKGPPP